MKSIVSLLCFLALSLPASAGPPTIAAFKNPVGRWLKPHPIRLVRFLAHHKIMVISSGMLLGANIAYARSYTEMQHRCPQCLFYGQTRPASVLQFDGLNLVGIAAATVMDDYIVRLHRTDGDVGVLAIGVWGAAWEAKFAYQYSQVNNLTDFNNMGINRLRQTGDFAPSAPLQRAFLPGGR